MHFISVLLWCFSIAVFVIFGSAFLLMSMVIPPSRLHRVGGLTCRLLLLAAGQRIRVSGSFPSPKEGPYIYMFNHASLLDNLVVMSVLPEFTCAIGKREQFKIPIWGAILRRWGAVPIDRNQLKQAIESLNQVGRLLSVGRSLLIAPEGTRSPNGQLLPFKKGPFHLAVQHQIPVVPMVISGAFQSKRKGSWLLRPGTIRVKVLSPVAHKQDESGTANDFLVRVRHVFEHGMNV
jgi:1-acyl-sn-glycerol-3-phosphate acyltransferase